MAAYYFLANGILDKISTRSKDFRITLRNLCVKIFKTAVSDKNEGGDDIHNTITGIEPAVSINAQKEQTTSIRSKSSCNGIALSTMEQLSLIDFSEAAHQASSSMSEDETLADKTENARISAPITEGMLRIPKSLPIYKNFTNKHLRAYARQPPSHTCRISVSNPRYKHAC
jgi:hypothetical protein